MVETVPPSPYLSAEPALASRWAGHLPKDSLLVGLVWAGQARPWLSGFVTLDRRRSMRLETLLPLATVPGVSLVSLQTGPPARELAALSQAVAIADPMPAVTDFADTAGIIANLDVVVSVDTAVVHLAGALGKPVFLLDRYDNCWRWLSGRTDTPWYPHTTIFRQNHTGDWSQPVARIAAALARLASFKLAGAALRPSPAPGSADAA
jgi:Glycosyltransferase family 9 (heptosyltransferase)